MTAAALRIDQELVRRRTQWTMLISFVVHVLLFLWFTSFKTTTQDLPIVTEVVLLEPGDLNPAAAAAPAPAPQRQEETVKGAPKEGQTDAHFIRMERSGDVALDPQVPNTFQDKLNSRLAAIQQQNSPLPVGTATGSPTASLFGSSPATVGAPGGTGTAPVKLNRGGGTGGPPLELSRGGTPGAPASLAPASIQAGKSEAAAPSKGGGDTTARSTIAGASLAGPIADRPVLFYTLPTYPDWAKKEAVEGSVTLYFVVRPDGTVKENILVQKTAGFGDFDDNARAALRAWRFEPLKNGRTGEQWGTITFHFRLRSAG
ncbi:MAG TPA: energy transducer TonB [Candidatus Eisenbacteria bacterium]|nr:energy transducer TonB [Candidatus Eisenbacteria bacterium]